MISPYSCHTGGFQMRLEAFAKINWSLDIVGVRDDGYHLMDMIMQPVSLADEVSLTAADDMAITTDGYPRSRADGSNLAMRAAVALRELTGYGGGIHIHVHKRIPMGAGLGGGSADAAAVLCGLNRMWDLGLTGNELEGIGLKLGADVPFLIRGGLARVRGIGEIIEPHACRKNYWMLVFQPCRGLSTREIFEAWNPEQVHHPDTEAALCALENGNLQVLSEKIGNVLEPVSAARRPEIGEAVRALLSSGARLAAMTGSGSAVFGVFSSGTEAEKAAEVLSRRWKHIHICHSQTDSVRISEE